MKQIRIWLARKILGTHCPCYKMGYHKLTDYSKHRIGKIKPEDKLGTHEEQQEWLKNVRKTEY
jgi:hypothetical protein